MANGRGVVPEQPEPHLSVVGNRRQLAQKCEAVTGRETIQIQTPTSTATSFIAMEIAHTGRWTLGRILENVIRKAKIWSF